MGKSGAPENKTIAELRLSQSFFTSFFPKDQTGIYPDPVLEPLDKSVIDSLMAMGLQVAPLYKTASMLKISAINIPDFDDQKAVVLLKALDHIVDLDLGQTQVTDAVFEVIQQLKHLTVLKLNRTAISGNGINKLITLEHLKQINMVNSNFEAVHLEGCILSLHWKRFTCLELPPNLSAEEIQTNSNRFLKRKLQIG